MSKLLIRNTTLSSDAPTICNALMGVTRESVIQETKILNMLGADIFEWRADCFKAIDSPDEELSTLQGLRKAAKDKPIIFSMRDKNSGADRDFSCEQRYNASIIAIESGCIDILEVELGCECVNELIECARAHGIATIVAAYDYHKTPDEDKILECISKCEALNGDIVKLAFSVCDKSDVLRLSDIMLKYGQSNPDTPKVIVGMGKDGIVTRILPKFFNSVWTYASGISTTLEGQVNLHDLRSILNVVN